MVRNRGVSIRDRMPVRTGPPGEDAVLRYFASRPEGSPSINSTGTSDGNSTVA